MIVLHVISTEFNDNGKRWWSLFEVDASGIQEVTDKLNEGKLVYGFSLKFRTDPDDPSAKLVFGARETTLSLDEVHKLQHPTWRLVRYEDDDMPAAPETLLLEADSNS